MKVKENTEPVFNLTWGPLESAIGKGNCPVMMYMGGRVLEDETIVIGYKHFDTRRYLHLSEDGRVWKYEEGEYSVINVPAIDDFNEYVLKGHDHPQSSIG